MPVRFECNHCREPWWAPPGNGCPGCGADAVSTPDPIVWTIGQVPETNVSISGQMLNAERFREIVAGGFTTLIDVAGDLHYVWRPSAAEVRAAGVRYVRLRGVEDTNLDLPDWAFDEVATTLESTPGPDAVLLFCAAGLKRSPHLMYGVLRRRGDTRAEAWRRVQAARPFTAPFQAYIDAAERWTAGRSGASATRTNRPADT